MRCCGEAVNINKRYISSFFMRSSTLGRSGGLGILASNILFCLALADAGAETMKLFRTAFWLGVVIYNLPSPYSQPAAPESPLGSQGSPAHCAKKTDTHPKRGDPAAQSSSRKAATTPSKDTLAPADRAVPWRGPVACNLPLAKRTAKT